MNLTPAFQSSGERAILLRYNEIALKGENRAWFEERLAMNARKLLRRALGPDTSIGVSRQHGRVIVQTDWKDETRETLSRLFGVSSFSSMREVPTQLETLRSACIEEFSNQVTKLGLPKSFRVFTRRSDKVLPETSMQIDRFIGSAIQGAFPSVSVNLKQPEWILGLEIRADKSYVWMEKIPGPAGLPVGTNGGVLALISGGLDSPVAAIKALRRGSPVSFIHFYGAPFVGPEVLEKVEELVRLVNRFQPDPQPLYVMPFGKIQEAVALKTSPKMRTILYRRLMMRIASELCLRLKRQALVTGESLGQVASQTLENISVIDEVSRVPVLRPLITFDKDEIIADAKKWGTYETSILPGTDCCTLFADRHPTIRSQRELIEEQESFFSVPEILDQALRGIEKIPVRR